VARGPVHRQRRRRRVAIGVLAAILFAAAVGITVLAVRLAG
jgi:hypothetical protein